MPQVIATVFSTDGIDSSGYEVAVIQDDGSIIEEYSATGNPMDSQQEGKTHLAKVRKWARITARDMFHDRFGRDPVGHEIEIRRKNPQDEDE